MPETQCRSYLGNGVFRHCTVPTAVPSARPHGRWRIRYGERADTTLTTIDALVSPWSITVTIAGTGPSTRRRSRSSGLPSRSSRGAACQQRTSTLPATPGRSSRTPGMLKKKATLCCKQINRLPGGYPPLVSVAPARIPYGAPPQGRQVADENLLLCTTLTCNYTQPHELRYPLTE